jgi:transposase
MTWRSQSLPPVPQTTATMVKAAFPKGNLYVDLHTEFGAIYDDDQFADLYSTNRGRPVEVTPWRLALVTVCSTWKGSAIARRPMPCAAVWIGNMP